MLTALALLLLSVWGVIVVLEKTQPWQFYLFLFGVVIATPVVLKAVWDSWADIRELRAKASKGDRDSMYWLAEALRETDMDGAMYWAEKGAALGHRDANFLAGYLRYGRGIRDQQTLEYFVAAAEKGSEPAMRALADCYKLGHCVLPSDRLSFEWRFKSASNPDASFDFDNEHEYLKEQRKAPPGFVCSQHAVGVSYLAGEGCEKNEVEGYAWLLLAARAGHADAAKRIRAFDRRKDYKMRTMMQDRAAEIAQSMKMGDQLVPVTRQAYPQVGEVTEDEASFVSELFSGSAQSDPVSAWRAFFTVLLAGNLMMAVLISGAKVSGAVPIESNPLFGALYGGIIAAALVAAFYGRKTGPILHFLVLTSTFVAVSAGLAFWGAPAQVGQVMGASLPTGSVVLPLSLLLMHWRHAVADYIFYGLIAFHGIGLIIVLV
jgi:hypothetical protein